MSMTWQPQRSDAKGYNHLRCCGPEVNSATELNWKTGLEKIPYVLKLRVNRNLFSYLVYKDSWTYSGISNVVIWLHVFNQLPMWSFFAFIWSFATSGPIRKVLGRRKSLRGTRPTNVKPMGVCFPTSSHSQTLNINLTLLENMPYLSYDLAYPWFSFINMVFKKKNHTLQ